MLLTNVYNSLRAKPLSWMRANFARITKDYAGVASKAGLGPITLIHPPNGAPKSIKEK